jgi:ribose-phosphate pyrophosphokinase
MREFVVAATRSMRDYASRVIACLLKRPDYAPIAGAVNGVDILKIDSFANGEMEVSITRSVRGKNVILFTSSARNDAGIGVEKAKIELYHTIDALKRSQARSIVVFEPFISCSRSDRTTRRNSVGLWVHFKILVSLGVRHIVTFQLHSNKSEAMLDPSVCTIDDIPVMPLLERYLCDAYIRDIKILQNEVRPNWAFCSVDAGGEKLARGFANAFGAPLVVAHKQRDYSKVNSIESINILSHEPIEGKVLWIIDDMIDTAGSVESLIRALSVLKPAEINVIAVHALFSNPAAKKLKDLSEEGLLNRVIVSDTVCTSCIPGNISRLEVVPSAELSARVIRTLANFASMSKLMEEFDAERYLKLPNLFNQ